jgi:glycosyltransferase involved in cell wall biosynthesis
MTVDAVGGVWTYACELVRALSARYLFVVACMGPRSSAGQREEMTRAGAARLEESDFALEWKENPWRDVDQAGVWLQGLARSEGAALVHLNGYCHGGLDFGVPKIIVGHSCVLSWWEAVRGGRAPAEWNEYAQRVRAGLRGVDRVVAPTQWMLLQLERHYGPLVRAEVIANGRGIHSPAARRDKDEFILGAGRLWDEAKNTALLEAAAREFPWRCCVAGENRGRAGELEPLGRLEPAAIRAWMDRAAVFVHPARYEPFGLAPLEAALAGCALVLGEIPSLREVWGDAAQYVGTDDAAALRNTVAALMRDRGLRESWGAAARERAALYSPTRMEAAYDRLYRDLLGAEAGAGERARAGAGAS